MNRKKIAYQKWQKSPKGRASAKRRQLKHYYGLSVEAYELMKLQQKGKCAICQKTISGKNLHVDHDHETDEVRGLLCSNCNTGIGLLGGFLISAQEYLYGQHRTS